MWIELNNTVPVQEDTVGQDERYESYENAHVLLFVKKRQECFFWCKWS